MAAQMADPQITARLHLHTKQQFEQYAESFGLVASELAKLLIVRERYQRRLAKLKEAGKVAQRPRRSASSGASKRLPTITARLSSAKDVEDFDAYVIECGFNRSSAGAYLFETEVRERWLERAMLIR
jgi:hypothetical protein